MTAKIKKYDRLNDLKTIKASLKLIDVTNKVKADFGLTTYELIDLLSERINRLTKEMVKDEIHFDQRRNR